MKKIVLLCILFSTLFLMTGCGASVTSKTKFNQDGSGTRTISAEISASDAKNLDGGFLELDQLLEEAAPEGVSINRLMQDNNDAIYQFTFHFDNIEEYNQKIYSITGKPHNATWYTNPSIFKSDVEFKEDDCTYELISWAIKAFKDSKYSKFTTYFKMYDVKANEIYYNDELVFSGTGNPYFTIKISPKVKKAAVYSAYDFNGERSKLLEIEFEQGSLEMINVEDVKKLIGAYSTDYKIDLANDKITYMLRNEEITKYLLSAGLTNKEEDLTYEYVSNPFKKEFTIKEEFSLEEFFSMFDMEYSYIYHYIKLPEKLSEVKARFSNEINEVELPEGYDYAGAFRYDSTAFVDITASQSVSLANVEVTYSINKELDCSRRIIMEFIKNGCNITEKEIRKYYETESDEISVSDNGDTLKVEFKIKKKKEQEDDKSSSFTFERLSRLNLRYLRYLVKDNLNIQEYFPTIEGDVFDLEGVKYTYQILIEKEAGVKEIFINDAEVALQTNGENQYQITGTNAILSPMSLEILLQQQYPLYYLWLIGMVFVIIIGILTAVLLKIKKRGQGGKDFILVSEEDEDGIYEN